MDDLRDAELAAIEARMAGRREQRQTQTAAQREAGLIPPLETAGKVIIEWPRDYGAIIPGWALCVYDADTGAQITTVTGMVIHAPADGLVWAQMTMFTTADGKPIFSGTDEIAFRDGEALTGTFPFRVQGMRVRDA